MSIADTIALCSSIDEKAAAMYASFSSRTPRDEVKVFWRHMAGEEREHVEYWQRLYGMAMEGMIPQLFDKPREVREELEGIAARVDELTGEAEAADAETAMFLSGCRAEFYMLNASYLSLFNYLKAVSGEPTPADGYEQHLHRFTASFDRFGVTTPELGLLGETLLRLWRDNRDMLVFSHVDPLTGILNRRGLLNALTSLSCLAMRNHYNVGVMLVDIDDLRKINDVYGYHVGDMIIKSVSATIRAYIRTSDVIGRYGSEEFMVFMPSVESSSLYVIADRILKNIEEGSRNGVRVTVSIGVAQGSVRRNVEESLERLIREAEGCLQNSKSTGKNKVTCTSCVR